MFVHLLVSCSPLYSPVIKLTYLNIKTRTKHCLSLSHAEGITHEQYSTLHFLTYFFWSSLHVRTQFPSVTAAVPRSIEGNAWYEQTGSLLLSAAINCL